MIAFRGATPTREWRFEGATPEVAFAVPVEPRFETNNAEVAIGAAIAGGGITSALHYQVDDALRAGELVEVLGAYAAAPMPIQALYPSARLLSAKVQAFLDAVTQAGQWWRFPGRESRDVPERSKPMQERSSANCYNCHSHSMFRAM